jgi:CheY-like chemotaxis protein
MLLNLTANARDAILDGGLLTLKVENVTLTESHIGGSTIVPPGSYVLLSVTDTGCGMGESTLARIFEPFFTTKETGKGTGLGLSMVYGIVQQYHGQICVESAPGAGSTFRIYFPQEQRLPAQASPAVFTVDDLAPHHETVLLVEDEPGLRKLISVILSAEGYSILEAPDGVEALRVVKQHAGPIHLLLTDMIMPQMSGRQLAEKLLSLLPDIRVMLMSGNPAEMIEEEGDLDPRVQFLQKPFTPDALTEKLRAVLRRPRALKQSA